MRATWTLIAGMGLCAAGPATAAVWRVDADATGANTGASWTDAFTSLQSALAVAAGGDEIWAAEGTHRPTGRTDPLEPRSATFSLPSGVGVYGGFGGTESSRDQRDVSAHLTILNGDLAGNDNGTPESEVDNVHHVVTRNATGDAATLDGFRITAGVNPLGVDYGGGIYRLMGPLVLTNCQIIGNQAYKGGGGLYSESSDTLVVTGCEFAANRVAKYTGGSLSAVGANNLQVTDCVFRDSFANEGGAVSLFDTQSCSFTRCTFRSNEGAPYYGGAMYLGHSAGGTVTISQCHFEDNEGRERGGAIYATYGQLTLDVRDSTFKNNRCPQRIGGGGAINSRCGLVKLTNCTFDGNTAFAGGAFTNESPAAQVVNCGFFNNASYGPGGAVYNRLTTATYVNCAMRDNQGQTGAGGFNSDASVDYLNCTIAGNRSDQGPAVFSEQVSGGSLTGVANSILWGNTTPALAGEAAQIGKAGGTLEVGYSCVQGWTGLIGGSGSFGLDPRFEPGGSFLRLLPDSPCIDAGDNTAVPPDFNDLDADGDIVELVPLDVTGEPRFINTPARPDRGRGTAPIVDIGAVEYTEDCNNNRIFDACDVSCGEPGGACDVPGCGTAQDCDADATPDSCEPDTDGDGAIDDCDADDDNDGVLDVADNCRLTANTGQENSDADEFGDACDSCPGTIAGVPTDGQGCPPVFPGDMDRDGDVDLEDFGLFQACLCEAGMDQTAPACSKALMDGDADVDINDTALFEQCLTGPGVPASVVCGQ